MAVFERTSWVDASLDSVWTFHSDISGWIALTPDWMRLQIESIIGPAGDPDPEVLEPGTMIRASIRPLGFGPRRRWVSRITARERSESAGMFRDVMLSGPFRRWIHTHRFYEEAGGTRIVDHVEYLLPLGPFEGVSGLAWVGLEPMFRYRHRETRARLE